MAFLRSPAALAAVLACLGPAGCGDGSGAPHSSTGTGGAISARSANGDVALVLATTRSREQQLLAQIYGQALRAAGFRVELARVLAAGGSAIEALERGRVGAYPRLARVPAAEQRTLEEAGVAVLPSGPPLRSNGMALVGSTARRLKVEEISGLQDHAQKMTLAVPRGCQREPDCLPALKHAYGLDFRRVEREPPGLVHEALRTGRAQVALVTSTDPHIRRGGETLLADDRRAFPAAGPVVLVRRALARRGGRSLRETLDRADGGLTVAVMQELNARVAFDREPLERVAADYLRSTGLVPKAGTGPG